MLRTDESAVGGMVQVDKACRVGIIRLRIVLTPRDIFIKQFIWRVFIRNRAQFIMPKIRAKQNDCATMPSEQYSELLVS